MFRYLTFHVKLVLTVLNETLIFCLIQQLCLRTEVKVDMSHSLLWFCCHWLLQFLLFSCVLMHFAWLLQLLWGVLLYCTLGVFNFVSVHSAHDKVLYMLKRCNQDWHIILHRIGTSMGSFRFFLQLLHLFYSENFCTVNWPNLIKMLSQVPKAIRYFLDLIAWKDNKFFSLRWHQDRMLVSWSNCDCLILHW